MEQHITRYLQGDDPVLVGVSASGDKPQ